MNDTDIAMSDTICEVQETEEVILDDDASNIEEEGEFGEAQSSELESLRAEITNLRNELEERDKLDKINARMNSELSEFYEFFPESTLEEIPDEIWERVKRGASLSAEFSLHLRKKENERKRISGINEKNRKMSAGSIGVSDGERYYSPAEVRKMTPAQVKAHYDDIIESMRNWN